MWMLKRNDTNELNYKIERDSQKKNLWLLGEGIVKEGVWEGHVHTTIFKMDNSQGPNVYYMELYSMLCASLDGRGVWGRMDTCICVCMAESLLCSPETTTTLLIG